MKEKYKTYKFKQKFRIKRIIVSIIVLSLLSLGIYLFIYVEDFAHNFKLSYIDKIYIPVLKYRLNNSNTGFYSIIPGFNNSDPIIEPSSSKANSIPVLLYHGIVEEEDGSNIKLDKFRDQMFALKKEGYQTITLSDFNAFMNNEKELPAKSFLLTFDDGRSDSYYPVDPILKALDYNAVIFVITDQSLNQEYRYYFYLFERELKKMINSGRWEIQSHGNKAHYFYEIDENGNEGHFYSNLLWINEEERLETNEEFTNRIYEDLISSKNDLEKNLEIEVISFAYPFGDYGRSTINFPESEQIILTAVSKIYPLVFYQIGVSREIISNYPDESEFMIKRISVKPDWEIEYLISLLERS